MVFKKFRTLILTVIFALIVLVCIDTFQKSQQQTEINRLERDVERLEQAVENMQP